MNYEHYTTLQLESYRKWLQSEFSAKAKALRGIKTELAKRERGTAHAYDQRGLNEILLGNAEEKLSGINANTVDCCVSSPPYWGQRNYEADGQIGQEEDADQYIERLVAVYREVKRTLKETGTCFVNLGDTFTDKCLMLLPERFAIAMIQDGWTLRNQIIWHKPNGKPSSVTDRFTIDHEVILFFVKSPKNYYFNQQLEPYTKEAGRWGGDMFSPKKKSKYDAGTGQTTYRERRNRPNPDGKNMRTVWSINTTPSQVAHFAAYPEELARRMIEAGCVEGGTVLDPFVGSGTTTVVAAKLNRAFIGIDINEQYTKITQERMHDVRGLFK